MIYISTYGYLDSEGVRTIFFVTNEKNVFGIQNMYFNLSRKQKFIILNIYVIYLDFFYRRIQRFGIYEPVYREYVT